MTDSMYNACMDKIRFTQKGYDDLKQELADLKAERPGVIEDVQKARELGDLKENGYYQASKAKLRTIDSRMTRITYYLKVGEIVAEQVAGEVGIGTTVTLKNDVREMTYAIVGDLEANPSEGKLSLRSPIGKALERKKQGDEVEIVIPSGTVKYKIVKVV
jgi:transcription elongation factor GreA